MKKFFIVLLIVFNTLPLLAYDIDHVLVTWTQNGSSQSRNVTAAGTTSISRDPGTPINVRIYKSTTAPNSCTFTYAAFNFGGNGSITSTNASELFNNVAVAGTVS